MIQGTDADGRQVLINPAMVVEVYAQILSTARMVNYGDWCNVQTTSGSLHRFKAAEAMKVYTALAAVPVEVLGARAAKV